MEFTTEQDDRSKNDPATVLLVDDEENVLRSLTRILRREPYRIVTAMSGPEALELLCREPVQMIVSDQRMPEMTGIELLTRVRELHPDIVRVILTGYSDLKTAEDAINQVEIYRFLNKPWQEEDIKSTIRQGLEKRRLELENRTMLKTIEEQNRQLKEYNEKLEEMVEDRTRALRETQSQLIQSEKMASLGVLAGGVAHELNNPLGGILGITQLVLMERGDEDQLTQDLRTIHKAALHCSEIVKNLLGFARKSEQKSREQTRLPELVDEVILLIGHLFRGKEIEIVKEFAPDFPPLHLNPPQIKQVLLNLLVNANQAMAARGAIKIRGLLTKKDQVVIDIIDRGKGIPRTIIDKIFDPFFTTKPQGEGTGLGLSVSYRIVKEHGGKLLAISEEGKGTCMRILLPRNAVAAEDKPKSGNGPAAGFAAEGRSLHNQPAGKSPSA